jgi:hypothetical protein
MNKFDYLQKAMQGHVDLTQQLEGLAKGDNPLLAEVARILIRDAGKVRRELWSVTECMADEKLNILPVVQRYESTPLETVSYAKVATDNMLAALTPLRTAKSAPVSEVANRMYGETQLISDRLERVQSALFDLEFNQPAPAPNMDSGSRMSM